MSAWYPLSYEGTPHSTGLRRRRIGISGPNTGSLASQRKMNSPRGECMHRGCAAEYFSRPLRSSPQSSLRFLFNRGKMASLKSEMRFPYLHCFFSVIPARKKSLAKSRQLTARSLGHRTPVRRCTHAGRACRPRCPPRRTPGRRPYRRP